MLKLNARVPAIRDLDPFVARIETSGDAPADGTSAYLSRDPVAPVPAGHRAYFSLHEPAEVAAADAYVARLPESMSYLAEGDIVRVSPRVGEVWVVHRRGSPFNALLLTEQCNSDCLMCSQPPKAAADRHLVATYLDAIPLMDLQTPELGITGGEPTLLGDALFDILGACRDHLPQTALHMLTNGRLFQYLRLARRLADLRHPDLMLGIPLYSDLAYRHDFVVQAAGAFDQTVRGLMNLARCGVRIEIRIVLHAQTIDRLPQWAEFLARNLPFVEHVALMGLEMMGYVRMNLEGLWIDPADYQSELRQAVETLDRHGLNVSIYNHPLCLLPPDLWSFARKSISDWKNEYLPVCEPCAVRSECGGFFSSATLRTSSHIAPFAEHPLIQRATEVNQSFLS